MLPKQHEECPAASSRHAHWGNPRSQIVTPRATAGTPVALATSATRDGLAGAARHEARLCTDTMTHHFNRFPSAVALCAMLSLAPIASSAQQPASGAFAVLHTVWLPVQEVSGIKMQELSGLAWDADEQLLYAVSDRGTVFHFGLKLAAQRIERLAPVFAAKLRGSARAQANASEFNAEGLAVRNADNGVRGDTELVIALENGPAVVRFTPHGEAIAEVPLPGALADASRYRGKNKRLESIAAHPTRGFVMAPEAPLRGEPATRHTLYATSGGRWSFEALQEGSDVKAIETLPDGRLLVLERVEGAAPKSRAAALRTVDPAACAQSACAAGDAPSGAAVFAYGNYEGMARVSDTLLMLVSDGGITRQGAASFALVEFRPR